MSFLRVFPRPCLRRACATQFSRAYAAAAASKTGASTPAEGEKTLSLSSCPPNTVLAGLNYLKGQPPVLALPDEEYPPWLWDLLKPRTAEDDGPGGKAEKRRLRKENRQKLKDRNFMKTQ
ncbi:mitochondrial ribosomal protein L37-domain-containing protein [Hygrophoropsis aurantiaca]|uniref:Mitochondrial ribosomal protein L37-domain-containing protein n=1 Tax=Hygrophoropsis aurantiaca TaxID=72124 RepID=A0ACB7ZY59_9AGAM|nr:mitochondrial ribosomal protein L37-domain-containing protein [Hygrophoropsis aurantiaca]